MIQSVGRRVVLHTYPPYEENSKEDEREMRYRRLYIEGAIYFVTTVVRERKPIFNKPDMVELLLDTLREVKKHHPFAMNAYAILFEHCHLLLRPTGASNISAIMHSFKRNVTVRVKQRMKELRSMRLWQGRFWEHVIRDEKDLVNHYDYIHFNPVKHGLVGKPEDYPWSSYSYWLANGYYEVGWGHAPPENTINMDFE